MSPPLRTHSHACLGTQISTSVWVRRDPSSVSLTRLRENHSSIRTSRSSRCVLTAYCIHFYFRIFIIPSTRRQQCFAGNANSTNSTTTQASSSTATDSASQTSSINASATSSASQSSATSATATDSASQTSATDATATANSRRRYDAPRAVRHSARFGRSYLALPAELT